MSQPSLTVTLYSYILASGSSSVKRYPTARSRRGGRTPTGTARPHRLRARTPQLCAAQLGEEPNSATTDKFPSLRRHSCPSVTTPAGKSTTSRFTLSQGAPMRISLHPAPATTEIVNSCSSNIALAI
ncbi:MAG: hypothetical protein KME26_26955 [Oscillatoria princeps RMCB-10]|nr:hypothetical protein [Oscillatoria princeps RMCB-10]